MDDLLGQRRHQDHFGRRAQDEGWGARSVYKLEEIDRRFRLFQRGGRVLDLGCAPGSWSKWAHGKGVASLVGLDIQEVHGYPGAFLRASIHEVSAEGLLDHLGGRADVVLSDMAPSTSGNRLADHVAQIELARAALSVARTVLSTGGSFVCKIFDGEDATELVDEVRRDFTSLKRVRPEATRRESREFFVVATGFLCEAERRAAP